MFLVGLAGDNFRFAAEALRWAVPLFRVRIFSVNLGQRGVVDVRAEGILDGCEVGLVAVCRELYAISNLNAVFEGAAGGETKHFDAPFEVSAALARHELIARTATQRALAANGGDAKWARIAIRATEARTQLLQDLGLLDRSSGRCCSSMTQESGRLGSRPAWNF